MAERVVAVIEARMGSTRLAGKSLMRIGDAPLLGQVLRRARAATSVHDVVVATSVERSDDAIADYVASVGGTCYRGSEHDVLARILGASREAGATIHVQCWGDCAFLDPTEVDRVVAAILETGADLATNSLAVGARTLPYGLDVIAVRVAALEVAERETRDDPYHREHGTTYLYETGRFRVERLPTPEAIRYPTLDLTVNTAEDLEFVRRVYAGLSGNLASLDGRSLVAFLRDRPELLAGKNARSLERAQP